MRSQSTILNAAGTAELHAAYQIVATGKLSEVEAAAKKSSGVALALLRGVAAQYNGDVDRAISLLQRQIAKVPLREKAFVADVLAPIFVMRHDATRVRALSAILKEAGWSSSAHAFLSLMEAEADNRASASEHMNTAMKLLDQENDDVIRFRVLQRLALSAFYLKRYDESIDLAFASAAISSRLGAWRAASSGYSIAYTIHYTVTGNLGEADRLARLCTEAARKSDDLSFIHTYTVVEFELAAQFGDDGRINLLQSEMQRRPLPQQYAERFPLRFSQALVLGASDSVAMRSVLQVLLDTPGLSQGQRAMSLAAIAVSFAAENDDHQSRKFIQVSLSQLGRAQTSDPAYERADRRMARAFAAVACSMIGDHVHGRRILATGESKTGHGENHLPEYALETLERREGYGALSGAVRVCRLAIAQRSKLIPPAGLTPAELEVLRLFACGYNAVKIAKETKRSVNTIYNHSRAILEKLDASRVGEAVAIARSRGLTL